jgi:hypothetical protein
MKGQYDGKRPQDSRGVVRVTLPRTPAPPASHPERVVRVVIPQEGEGGREDAQVSLHEGR